MIKWRETFLVALVMGVVGSVIAFAGSGGSLSCALGGLGLGVCVALGLAVMDAVLTKYYDCQEGDPF